MKYHSIVFLHDYEDEFVEFFFNNQGAVKDLLHYLETWDTGGECEHSPRDDKPWGAADTIEYEDDEYVLTTNSGLGYVALTRKAA